MSLRTRIEPIDRDIAVLLADIKGPAQSAALASFAREKIEEAKTQNASVLGRTPKYEVYVDGSKGGRLEQVKPDGRIVAEFELVSDILSWIAMQLKAHHPPPTVSGHFAASFMLFADGVEVADVAKPPPNAREYVFINVAEYAYKLEFKYGLFEAIAVLARDRAGTLAKVQFAYRFLARKGSGGRRAHHPPPAIVVTVK